MYPVCVLHNGGEHACVFVEDLPQALQSADAVRRGCTAASSVHGLSASGHKYRARLLYSNLKSMRDGSFLWRQIVCINIPILLHAELQPD